MRDKRNHPSSVTADAVPPSPQGEGLKAEERQKQAAAKSAADDMEVHILLHKAAGESGYRHEIRAGNGADAVYGTAVLIRDLAKATGRTVEQTLALLATVLLTANGPERADVGIGPYDERSSGDGQD